MKRSTEVCATIYYLGKPRCYLSSWRTMTCAGSGWCPRRSGWSWTGGQFPRVDSVSDGAVSARIQHRSGPPGSRRTGPAGPAIGEVRCVLSTYRVGAPNVSTVPADFFSPPGGLAVPRLPSALLNACPRRGAAESLESRIPSLVPVPRDFRCEHAPARDPAKS